MMPQGRPVVTTTNRPSCGIRRRRTSAARTTAPARARPRGARVGGGGYRPVGVARFRCAGAS
eukprot:9000775-Alexandrium_andersonii.AAC.1